MKYYSPIYLQKLRSILRGKQKLGDMEKNEDQTFDHDVLESLFPAMNATQSTKNQ
jgi:hypothetical protein